jgi:glucose-6-phosphate 1-dehydrogenase
MTSAVESRTTWTVPDDHVVVLFGATGDLAKRKLIPGLFRLGRVGLLPRAVRILGTSPVEMDAQGFRDHVRDSLQDFAHPAPSEHQIEAFLDVVSYVVSTSDDMSPLVAAVDAASTSIGGRPRLLHYLSVPPFAFGPLVEAFDGTGLNDDRARVIIEKPFGHDEDSAKALNALLHSRFDEEQIFRIDHFLGKEDVQNILAVRFANSVLEPVWNRRHVAQVQIDVPETLGLEGRAGFYEGTGAFRDMVVTHLFQALSVVAMERPQELHGEALATEKLNVFESMLPVDPGRSVRGQYEGYLSEPGVKPDSQTETFVALEARVENPRWEGVPFFLRTGKALAQGRRVITLVFHKPEHDLFGGDHRPAALSFEIAEPGGLTLHMLAKEPGPEMVLGRAPLQFRYKTAKGERNELEAYQRLLHDAMTGDRTLFTRARGIERLWEVAQPLLVAPPAVEPYAKGSWGPDSIHDLVAPHQWHLPDDDADSI